MKRMSVKTAPTGVDVTVEVSDTAVMTRFMSVSEFIQYAARRGGKDVGKLANRNNPLLSFKDGRHNKGYKK